MRNFNILKDLKVRTKLGLVVLCMAIPIVSLMIFLFSSQQKAIRATKGELYGIEYVSKTLNLLTYIAQSHNIIKLSKSGDRFQEDNLVSIHDKVDNELRRLQGIDSIYSKHFKVQDKIDSLVKDWVLIKEGWEGMGPLEMSETHANLQSKVLNLTNEIINKANLKLDAENVTSTLIDTLIDSIPEITNVSGNLQSLGVDIILRKVITFEEENGISDKLARLENNMTKLGNSLAILQDENPGLYTKFKKEIEEANIVTEQLIDTSRESMIEDESLTISAFEYFQAGNASLDAYTGLSGSVYDELVVLLRGRVSSASFNRNMQFLIALMLTAVAVLVSVITYRYITGQVASIIGVFDQIDKGDFEARSEIFSSDELGSTAASLNDMLDRTLSLIQSQDERDAIQDSIMKLLDEVSDVAKGDLTVEAEVTEDVTGAIADSFNHMIYQLRHIVLNVQDATLQVSSSASYIQSTAEQLADGSSTQAEQIIDSSAALDEMAVSIQQVSENASLSSTVAEQALANAKQGAQAVQNTIQGMQRIRSQVQETAKRIKRLGERSQEISEIVQLIGDIADRTSILALNASIQAARAGEAGRSFAVVAEEVERLAERATNATKQIGSLVNTIQSETNEAVIAMEESTHEVVQGSQVADKAGQALSEIESVSSRLADLIQSISLASTQQARGSDNLSKAMNEISEVTQHTATGTKQTASAISQLASLADGLRESVSTFRIPMIQNKNDADKAI